MVDEGWKAIMDILRSGLQSAQDTAVERACRVLIRLGKTPVIIIRRRDRNEK